jgi:hypothetical protein
MAPAPIAQFPYDRVTMTHKLHRGTLANGQPRFIERPVAHTIDEAMQNRYDYWHPGGEIRLASGRVVGSRPPGWFLFGYKWQTDRLHNESESLPLDELLGSKKES